MTNQLIQGTFNQNGQNQCELGEPHWSDTGILYSEMYEYMYDPVLCQGFEPARLIQGLCVHYQICHIAETKKDSCCRTCGNQ